jgi:hypothetical protein
MDPSRSSAGAGPGPSRAPSRERVDGTVAQQFVEQRGRGQCRVEVHALAALFDGGQQLPESGPRLLDPPAVMLRLAQQAKVERVA